ncbi:hypothetical protein AAII07_50415 [Microvirga sp. 0TCS3.31]
MKSWQKTLLAAAAVCAISTLPALADKGGTPNSNSNTGAPGPIAGAGLPFLLLAGGYVLARRYRNRGQAE